MRLRSICLGLAVVLLLAGCSSEKKVGSAIDVDELTEKGGTIGQIELPEDEQAGGFVGAEEQRAAEQRAAQARAKANEAQAEEQKEASSVSFAITAAGYDPYFIRVYTGGVVSVTNRDSTARTVTADDGGFDSGLIAPGETWRYEPATAGKFNFHDETRPFVVGTLEVLAG